MKPQYVVCAALRHANGSLICGARHFDMVMHEQIAHRVNEDWRKADQGFIDQYGAFLTREQAYEIAVANGQHTHGEGHDGRKLFSEDLYHTDDELKVAQEQIRHLERRIRELTEQLNCMKIDAARS